jgi:hypothetical protein
VYFLLTEEALLTACTVLFHYVCVHVCSRPSCVRQHPPAGHLWCGREVPNGCSNPDCQLKHKLPLVFKLGWNFLGDTVGKERAAQFSDQPFSSFAAAVAYGNTLNSNSREKLPYHCVASSHEWNAHLRAAIQSLALKLGTKYLLSSSSNSTDGRASDSALDRCATALVQWIQQHPTDTTSAASGRSRLTVEQQEQHQREQAVVWRSKLLVALRSYHSLSSTLQGAQSQLYTPVAPTLVLERMRLRCAWFCEFFPVPVKAQYLQYATRDINVRLQRLLGVNHKDIKVMYCCLWACI